jgi:hypothetical protein
MRNTPYLSMRSVDKALQICWSSVIRVDRVQILGPVPMIPAGAVCSKCQRLLPSFCDEMLLTCYDWRDPYCIKPQILDIVKLRLKSPKRAATVVPKIGTWRSITAATSDTVGEDKVDAA